MALSNCVRMVMPVVSRRLAAPSAQQVRTLFDPWSSGPSDIRALVRDMDRQMDRLERQIFRGFPSAVFPRRLAPGTIDDTLGPREGGQYRVAVDLAGFKPEEINIALDESGRQLTVSARCERKGRDGSRYTQEVSRQVTLPESIDAEQLKSVLHHDGVLAIEAPFKTEQVEPKQIPINRVSSGEEQHKLEESSPSGKEQQSN